MHSNKIKREGSEIIKDTVKHAIKTQKNGIAVVSDNVHTETLDF